MLHHWWAIFAGYSGDQWVGSKGGFLVPTGATLLTPLCIIYRFPMTQHQNKKIITSFQVQLNILNIQGREIIRFMENPFISEITSHYLPWQLQWQQQWLQCWGPACRSSPWSRNFVPWPAQCTRLFPSPRKVTGYLFRTAQSRKKKKKNRHCNFLENLNSTRGLTLSLEDSRGCRHFL